MARYLQSEIQSETKSYIAEYWSTDDSRLMLGAVKKSRSSRFSHRADAEMRLQSAIDIHATLRDPLLVTGRIIESTDKPEIARHLGSHIAQAVGHKCPTCGKTVIV